MGRKDALDVLSKAITAFDSTARRIPSGLDDPGQYELRRDLEVVRQGARTLEDLGEELLGRSVPLRAVVDRAEAVLDLLKASRWDDLKTERQRACLQDLARFVGTVRGELVNLEAALEARRERGAASPAGAGGQRPGQARPLQGSAAPAAEAPAPPEA